jgi:hypothetical protein
MCGRTTLAGELRSVTLNGKKIGAPLGDWDAPLAGR